jgi:guanylate kinase
VIIVVSGPGGVGKGTVVHRLIERDPKLWLSRSWTTRERRPGEPEDAYVFATRDEFERRIADGGFIEWVEFLDYLQGSPVPDPRPESDVLFEIDVHGARQIRERYPDALLIFIDAPSRAEQEVRLRKRGDSPERVAQRIAKAEEEAEVAASLGCLVVVNDDLDHAVETVEGIIADARRAARS